MSSCPSCGTDLPAGARFCPSCGASVEAAVGEERRIVTILFVDLVGFTERSDHADPEDVRRTLVPFHARVKQDLERFGGTLDKFIGDAVMGVFGAPVAHDDDPVRAVRAAVRILASMDELRADDPELAVRVAVNTGEAVVTFGSGPQVGEAVAGDVVNTASRMQSLAPPGSVVVGEGTLRALRDRFETEPLPPAVVKGKAEPILVWRVVGERDAADLTASAFVGREDELSVLTALFERVVERGSIQTVTLIADPGLGKSRLVQELELRVGPLARRLTGYCLPYGEGVTFAPIAETVRAVAGIDPSDDASTTLEQVHKFADRAEDDPPERRWLVSRLSSAMGIAASDLDAAIPAAETADAWARVLAHAASERPLLLVIEDLHWADPAFVEVLGRTVEGLVARAVLLVATARPNLVERNERWVRPRADATTIELEPLPAHDTGRLLSSLLGQAGVQAPLDAALVERTGGNPLYALEFARMLSERVSDTVGGPATPESVQVVIAARLDAIPSELRALAHDAAVVGEEFWPGVLAALAGRSAESVQDDVEELVRRGILEPRTTSLVGQPGYGFTHSLIREVAYGRLPRLQRARRHLAAAEWLAGATGRRAEEYAEVLARHYAAAAELGDAAGEKDVADPAREPAVRWLLAAGDRAKLVDESSAFALYERALRIVPDRGRERVEVLTRAAKAGRRSGRLEASAVLGLQEEALAVARELDDPALVGDSLTRIGSQLGAMGESARSRDTLAEAVRILEALPPGRSLASAYAYRAEEELFAGHGETSRELADRALALLEGADELAIMCLHIRGDARCSGGDMGGFEDLREALRLAEQGQDAVAIATSLNYLADWRWAMEGPGAAVHDYEASVALAKRRGLLNQTLWSDSGLADALCELGEWDRALRVIDEMLGAPEERLDPSLFVRAHAVRTHILMARGRRNEVFDPEELLGIARRVEELQALVPALVTSATAAAADGRADVVVARLTEFDELTYGVAPEYRTDRLVLAVRCCISAGNLPLAERIVEGSEGRVLRDHLRLFAAEAAVAEARGENEAEAAYADLAPRWRAYGNSYEEAMALLGRARCAESAGRGAEAQPDRARAMELLATLGAVLPSF